MGLNLQATIGLNSTQFERGMSRVREEVGASLKSFVIGAIGVTTVEEAFRRTIETADELVNTAKRLGTTVEQVQLLRQAAKDAGSEMDSVATALEKINQARAKALGGDQKSIAAFSALGVNGADLKSKTAADLFMHEISSTVKRVSPEQIAAPLREVLGRGAGESIATLKTDFDELGKKMQESGAIMSGEVATKLKVIGDEFEILSRIITVQLAPAILAFVEAAYKAAIRLGGNIAGASAAAGSIYGQVGAKGTASYLAREIGSIIAHPLGVPQSITDQNLAAAGVKKSEVAARVSDAVSPWQKSLEEFQSQLNAAAAGSKNPAADFNQTQNDARNMRGNRHIEAASSLVKTGNFLGANLQAVHAASTAAQRAAETAKNTALTAKFTQMTAETLIRLMLNIPSMPSSRRDGGKTSTHFPNQ